MERRWASRHVHCVSHTDFLWSVANLYHKNIQEVAEGTAFADWIYKIFIDTSESVFHLRYTQTTPYHHPYMTRKTRRRFKKDGDVLLKINYLLVDLVVFLESGLATATRGYERREQWYLENFTLSIPKPNTLAKLAYNAFFNDKNNQLEEIQRWP
jgi:hypothetical protein